jgi:LacI family transcriptional regulator
MVVIANSDEDPAAEEKAVGTLLERQVTALLIVPTGSDHGYLLDGRASVGVLRALRGRESTFALVGFDDFELADMLPVPVTVVKHDPARMGRVAAELLFARLSGDEGPPHRIVLPTRLVPRGSGEIPGEPGS